MKKKAKRKKRQGGNYTKDQLLTDILRHRQAAVEADNHPAIARYDEILSKRTGLVSESPPRKAELDAHRQAQVDFLLRLHSHPAILEDTKRRLAEAEAGPSYDVYAPQKEASGGQKPIGLTPPRGTPSHTYTEL